VERAWAYRPVDQQRTHHPIRDFRQAACTSNDPLQSRHAGRAHGPRKQRVGENDEIDIDALEVRPEQVYSPDRLLKLIQSAEPGFAQTILTTFALTGLRHGEGLALMWRDIDFDQRKITIRRNWSGRYRDGEPVFSTPKTKHSIRKIHIGRALLGAQEVETSVSAQQVGFGFPQSGRPATGPKDHLARIRCSNQESERERPRGSETKAAHDSQFAPFIRFDPPDERDPDPRSKRPCSATRM